MSAPISSSWAVEVCLFMMVIMSLSMFVEGAEGVELELELLQLHQGPGVELVEIELLLPTGCSL
eukprot:m.270938 g.270938  ORF g.270938 m.270938 type:complete len:64 (-) comp26862_c5_seq6:2121-2312(-)